MLTNWRDYVRVYAEGVLEGLHIVVSVYNFIKHLNLKWLNALYLYVYDRTTVTVGQTYILASVVAGLVVIQEQRNVTFYMICVAILVTTGVILHVRQRSAEAEESGKQTLEYNKIAYAAYESTVTDISFLTYLTYLTYTLTAFLCLSRHLRISDISIILLWYITSANGFQLRPRRPRKSRALIKAAYA